jgi:hypothetical protein
MGVRYVVDSKRFLHGIPFPYSVNVSLPGSELRVQIQTDPRYAGFIANARKRDVSWPSPI